jgi:ribosome biogenesis GTPase
VKKGIVVKTTGSRHTVRTEDGIFHCRLKGIFRTRNVKITNPVAVGDHVVFEEQGAGSCTITEIAERRNYIIRKATNLSRESQIMAANIDQVILMFTLDFPETPLEFVDRFLVAAEAYHIPAKLVINKTDLYREEKLARMEEVRSIYEYAGYPVISISVTLQENIDQIRNLLSGKLTLIAGNSGIGKTSLINLLQPGLNLKTSDISWYHEAGKHTTTYPEMIEVAEKTWLIDSPGIRGFGLTDLEKNEIGLYFTDIFRLSKNCQFYNCTHVHEPNCAVLEAIENGELHDSRYRSYFNIYHDTSHKYRTG